MKMKPLMGVLLLATGTPVFAAGAPPSSQPLSFAEAVEVNVVNVDVQVTDKKGNRVTGLKKKDFEILEDGKPVEIVNFEALEGGGEAGRGSLEGGASPATRPASRPQEDVWNLVVFVDDLNIRPAHRARVLEQLRDFLAREVRPGDRVMLATYDMGLHIRVPFTSDPAALAKGLQEVSRLATNNGEDQRDRDTAIEAMMSIQRDSLISSPPVPCPQNIAAPAHAYASGRRQDVVNTLKALTILVNSLSGVPGRKAVLHVSDGLPLLPGGEIFQFLAEICGAVSGNQGFGKAANFASDSVESASGQRSKTSIEDSHNPAQIFDSAQLSAESYKGASQAPLDAQHYSVAKNLEELAAHANAHRVALYTLQASGLQGTVASDASYGPTDRLLQLPSVDNFQHANLRDSLQLLADETGGRAILDANQLLPDLSRMREDFFTLYSLGISPSHNGDGREHKLTVKVKRPDLRLRYRQSYRDKPVLERSVDRTLAALYYGIEENPLAVDMEIGDQNPVDGGLYAVPVRLRIPLFKLAIVTQDQTFEGKLRLLVAVRDEQGGLSAVRQVEVPLHIPRKEVLSAMGQYYLYTLTLPMKPGLQHVAVAVRDDLAATTSYLSRAVTAGAAGAAVANP